MVKKLEEIVGDKDFSASIKKQGVGQPSYPADFCAGCACVCAGAPCAGCEDRNDDYCDDSCDDSCDTSEDSSCDTSCDAGHSYDSSYESHPAHTSVPSIYLYSKKSRCFVATVVYEEVGGADSMQVAALRNFRDDVLAGTKFGRKLIDFYYGGFGEKAAELIEKKVSFAIPLIRKGLDYVVKKYEIKQS